MDTNKLRGILVGVMAACNDAGLKISINGDALLDASARIYNTEMINESQNQPLINSNPEKVADYPATDKTKAFAKSLGITFVETISQTELSALITAEKAKRAKNR